MKACLAALAIAVPLAGAPGAYAQGCPNAEFRTGPSAQLPDCRAYELITPKDTNLATPLAMRSTADGDAALIVQNGAAGDVNGVQFFTYGVARRSSDGWTTRPLLGPSVFPSTDVLNNLAWGFSPDLSLVLLGTDFSLDVGDDDDGARDVYSVGEATPASWISYGDVVPDTTDAPLHLVGASPDLGTVLFDASSSSPIASVPTGQIYARRGDELEAVSVRPDGTYPPYPLTAAPIGALSGHDGTPSNPSAGLLMGRDPGVVSDDGTRVFFLGGTSPGQSNPIFMRDLTLDTTVAITASKVPGEEGNPPAAARFIAASDDGSQVLFASSAVLTASAPANGGIYRYSVDTGTLTHLVPNPNGSANGGTFFAVASNDLSHVYFVSSNLHVAGASGTRNLYVWSQGGVRLIAPNVGTGTRIGPVTPSGQYALFTSRASLHGAPVAGKQSIYRYNTASDQLRCVSCRPDGTASQADAYLSAIDAGALPPVTSDFLVKPRNVASDGRVAFDTLDALVPEDQNGTFDVYEYAGGQVSVLTTGTSARPSSLGEISEDGDTVFLTTAEALVDADTDNGANDVYAVRREGGFAGPPAPPTPCAGDACQGPGQDSPALPSPETHVSRGGQNAAAGLRVVLSVGRIAKAQRRRAARSGVLTVRVRTNRAGFVRLGARARIGRRPVKIASGRRHVAKGVTRVRLRLSPRARRVLRRGRPVRVTLRVARSGARTQRLAFRLPGLRR